MPAGRAGHAQRVAGICLDRSIRVHMVKNKPEKMNCKAERYQLYGWLLFITCALLFIVESFINRQPLLFVGSIIFLLACFLFLVPLLDTLRNGKDRDKNYTRGKP